MKTFVFACGAAVVAQSALAVTVVEDFDSFASFANGQAVGNGATDASLFFDLTVTARNGDGLDGVIFDSDPAGPNAGSEDVDLLVDTGNVLTAQDGSDGTATPGTIFDPADDDVGFILTLDFIAPLTVESLLLVDIDGGTFTEITLIDESGLEREFDIPADFTGDVAAGEPGSFVIDLLTLSDQSSVNGTGPITAVEDDGFDQDAVVTLVFDTRGSGAIDDLVLSGDEVPTSGSLALLAVSGVLAGTRRRRA
ncbi:MAG: hypothetical protein AAGI30_14160 [Planctomycetota bacterium]